MKTKRAFAGLMHTLMLLVALACRITAADAPVGKDAGLPPLTVVILAGDENVLENAQVIGRSSGDHDLFFPREDSAGDEKKKHVVASVYAGKHAPDADFDAMEPVATAEVEIGYQRTRRAGRGKRGRVDIPMTPFPNIAWEDDRTTVLRGFLSVGTQGTYECHAGEGESSYNVTLVHGTEVYRRNPGAANATVTPIALQPKKRYALKTVFFGKPGHAFQLPRIHKPGTLETVVATNPKFAALRDDQGNWKTFDDVVLYDSHPAHNNTKAPAAPLEIVTYGLGGPERTTVSGVTASLGLRLGKAIDGPVLIIRHGVRHGIWFRRGSRDLSHDYRPPSSGGGLDHSGSWDVIHFNHGIHDTQYRDPETHAKSGEDKYPILVPLDEYEANLRKIVAKLKKTGATLIWARTTPVMDETVGWKAEDIVRYNEVADKIMKENGVIINDLYAESLRLGYPKRADVHSVGDLSGKVTETILEALTNRENPTRPLPRVLMIGDSITGGYWEKVKQNLDGKAYVCKNPANAANSRYAVGEVDGWLDLKRYLLNGQEYLQLVSGVQDALEDLDTFCPQYADRKVELAGFIWFQGIADGHSAPKAAAYEENLANLIRDIRKDLDAPKLPVVVAALPPGNQEPQQQVFDAQMAVGNPEAYAEFAGNVISIDTRPLYQPGDRSPGGRDHFRGNAESYLEIGDAMAAAILKLSNRTFSEMATPRPQVAGAPLPSDVCLSSRWRHPRNEDDPYDTFEIGDAFHATRLDWVYSFDPEWIRACRDRGYTFGATFNSKLPDQVGTETREEGRILDKNGKPVTAPWMVRWKAWWGCVNAPSYKKTFLDHAFRVVRGGADVIHVDDPGFNGTATHWGGCFCEHCKAKAAAQGVDLDDKEQMLAFQRASVEAFYRDVRAKIDQEAGRHIVFSCNNGGWGWPDYLFEFGICEFGSRTPNRFYRRILAGREKGRNQVFTLGRRDVRVNRYVIAMTYAMGSHLIVPWDVYLQITATTSSRLYGEPSEYADLYGFVRSMAEYLDGYGEAAVTGWKLENWASKHVHIDGEETIALVRAKPGNPDAPVVAHVVDWNPEAGRTLKLSADALGYREGMKATFYTPVLYDQQTHGAVIKAAEALRGDGRRGAGQAEAFAPLRQAKQLEITRRDDHVVVSLPKVDGWGIVVFESSEEKKR